MTRLVWQRSALPVLCASDVVVAGGSLAGVSAALYLARTGRRVTLVEPRTYLGYEVTAVLRPWIPEPPEGVALPEVVAACIEASNTCVAAGEFPLHPDAVKTRLEDLLLEAGVGLLYASTPVGVCVRNDAVQGIVIANKSGRQVLTCQVLVDATPTALLARLSGAPSQPLPKTAYYTITLEFDGVAFQEEGVMVEGLAEIEVPAHLGVKDGRLVTHRGYRPGSRSYQHGHTLIECAFELPARVETAFDLTTRYIAARQKAIDVASYLLWEHPYFRLAHLGSISQDLCGPQAGSLAGPAPAWASGTGDAAVCAAPVAGLWCLNEAARVVDGTFRDPVAASHVGTAVARAISAHWQTTAVPAIASRPASPAQSPGLQICEPESPQRGCLYEQWPVEPSPISIIADVDVLVVGGGTSGAIATVVAAREGARTCVVEMNPGLGGTGTYGGVKAYWAGWQRGFTAQSREWVNRMHDRLRYPPTHGLVGEWNIEAKVQALTCEAQNAGAQVLFGACVFGALVQDNAVRGVVAATPLGMAAILGKVVIDATGDGDVAVFAGAGSVYGSARDHAVMWFSLPQFSEPGHTRNNFTSMVDVSNVKDYTRAILSGRRRGGRLHDHGMYVAARESRHVDGDVKQTLTDQLLHRCWPDVINVAMSNNDIKGQISSDWMRIGLIPPNLQIESPYRMLLPRGLGGILVVGKAVSASRDALASIRMQPDLENLGGAAGLAAVQAVQKGIGLREIDVRALQEQLVEIGVLPEDVLTRQLAPLHYSDTEVEALIAEMMVDLSPLHAYSQMPLNEVSMQRIPLVEVVCAGPQAVPLLERALSRAVGPARVRVAQALAILQSPAAAPVLAAALEQLLAGSRLPQRGAPIQHAVKFAPDQAAMPDAAYLLYALGLTRDRCALPVWQRVVGLLAFATEEDVWSQDKGVFAYVDAVCLGAERLGDPAAIPILKQLHSYEPFRGKQLASGFQADYLLERPAYLEVVIGRALARCGGPDGVVILINYLNDARALLAEQAHDELVAISGCDFDKDAAAWGEWLESAGESLPPVPWSSPPEPTAAWNETVLRKAP